MSTAGGTPATAPKAARKLPFKRTVKRKSVDVTGPGSAPKKKDNDDDDALGLFKRSGDFFQEQQRLSAAKPDKKPPKPKPSPLDDEDEATYSTQAEAQLFLESSQTRPRSSSEKKNSHTGRNESKRVCIELSGDDSDEGHHPQGSRDVRRDSSALQYPSTSNQRSPLKARASPRTRSAAQNATPKAISLDDSEGDDATGPAFSSPRGDSRGGKGSLRAEMAGEEDRANRGSVDSDSEPEAAAQPSSLDDGLDDMTRRFVLEARERMEREKAARLAREANPGAPPAPAEPPATIIIESHVPNTHHLTTRVKLSQQMQLVKSSWVLHNTKKKAPWDPEALDAAAFFTWKGRKIYPHTTLASLGIKPNGKGQLTPKWEANKTGFVGWDKVHFEAWTQDLFEEAEREKERERRRQLGELDEDDDDTAAAASDPVSPGAESEETKIRLICKSRNHGNQSMTVPLNVALSAVATAFRRMKNIPDDKNIDIHFDGAALDLSCTLAQAEIEDEDCVEVHIS